jgi:hypothetical protein
LNRALDGNAQKQRLGKRCSRTAQTRYCAPRGLSGSTGGCLNLRPGAACLKAGRKSRNNENDKFSLPTGTSLTEDIFKAAPRGFITDVEFDCGGLKFVSRDQTKR